MPLWRVAVFVTTLHPDVCSARRFLWTAATGVTTSEALFSVVETDEYRTSPFAIVYDSRKPLRYRFAIDGCPDIPVLQDLAAGGATDYVAFPLRFSDGTTHVATWSTRQPAGFTGQQFAALESVIAPLARVAEIRALRRTAGNLIETYVGNQTGERILAGKIRRGHVETLRAAIWLSDMRGFTTLAERLPPQALIDLLNQYFDCQVPAIAGHGGEVLKFMGDGLLAIFPLWPDDESDTKAGWSAPGFPRCARVGTSVARGGRTRGRPQPSPRGERSARGPLRARAACRTSDVWQYRWRQPARFHLHWTCGQSVAARLEKLAAKTGQRRTVIARRRNSRLSCRGRFTTVGEFSVAGFAAVFKDRFWPP